MRTFFVAYLAFPFALAIAKPFDKQLSSTEISWPTPRPFLPDRPFPTTFPFEAKACNCVSDSGEVADPGPCSYIRSQVYDNKWVSYVFL